MAAIHIRALKSALELMFKPVDMKTCEPGLNNTNSVVFLRNEMLD